MSVCILQVNKSNATGGGPLLVQSVTPDLGAQRYLLTDLEPTTDYILEICISNGMMKQELKYFITTATGECVGGRVNATRGREGWEGGRGGKGALPAYHEVIRY